MQYLELHLDLKPQKFLFESLLNQLLIFVEQQFQLFLLEWLLLGFNHFKFPALNKINQLVNLLFLLFKKNHNIIWHLLPRIETRERHDSRIVRDLALLQERREVIRNG